LLPALPKEWAAGSVHGLRARGGFVVNLDWSGGKLTSATVYSPAGGACHVRYGNIIEDFTIGKGKAVSLDGSLKPSK
jgi:alpha-L-fucosidase 2